MKKSPEPARPAEVVLDADCLVVGSGQCAGAATAVSLHAGQRCDRLDRGRAQRVLTRQGARSR